MKPLVCQRAGIRFFECEECEHKWMEATRDYCSPSGESCPRCHDHTPPHHSVKVEGVHYNKRGGIDEDEVYFRYGQQIAKGKSDQ